MLAEKRLQIEAAIQAIEEAEQSLQSGTALDPAALKKIIEVMERQNSMEWTKKYYSEEAQAKIAERAREWTPEMQAAVEQKWKTLISEVETAITLKLDPASARAQELARRWQELLRGFTGSDPQIEQGLKRLYADQQNWPQNFRKPFSDAVCEYMAKVAKAQGI